MVLRQIDRVQSIGGIQPRELPTDGSKPVPAGLGNGGNHLAGDSGITGALHDRIAILVKLLDIQVRMAVDEVVHLHSQGSSNTAARPRNMARLTISVALVRIKQKQMPQLRQQQMQLQKKPLKIKLRQMRKQQKKKQLRIKQKLMRKLLD